MTLLRPVDCLQAVGRAVSLFLLTKPSVKYLLHLFTIVLPAIDAPRLETSVASPFDASCQSIWLDSRLSRFASFMVPNIVDANVCQAKSASPLKIIVRRTRYPKMEIENEIASPFARGTVVVARHCWHEREEVGHRGYQRQGQGVRPGAYPRKNFWRI